MTDDQLDIHGGSTPTAALDLAEPALAVFRALERGERVTSLEAGQIVHERKGVHGRDHECPYCRLEGKRLLERFRELGLTKPKTRRGPAGYDPATAPLPEGF